MMKRLFLSVFLSVPFLSLLTPGQILAQAGSSVPVVFDSPGAFYDSVSGMGFRVGAGGGHIPLVPEGVLLLPRNERYVLWAELAAGRLKLLEQQQDGGLIVRRIIPMSIGANGTDKQVEGDKRTPVGVYYLTSFLDDSQLTDFYGSGAFPLNYPNAQDLLRDKTGSGIWLHGLPKGVSQRPLLDSDGCVVIDNQSLQDMMAFLEPGRTPIILSEGELQWVAKTEAWERAAPVEEAFENWRLAWESLDSDRYLSFYADDFSNLEGDKAEWSAYKRRVNGAKSSISVRVSDLSFLSDPKRPDTVTVRYFQRYRSSNYNWNGWKDQLWQEIDGRWQIIYEG